MPESPSSNAHQVLEINLISAQDLKPPTSPRRRLQTYALTWVDPIAKLRTRVDQIGGENPTWNDKFLFRVSPQFLASETSAVSVAIYSVGLLRDNLIGTVRFLVSNVIRSSSDGDGDSLRTPSFCALQIRRPSGSFKGVMNIGAMVLGGSDFPALTGISAIGYRDLMGEKAQHRGKHYVDKKRSKPKHADELSSESCENSCADSMYFSDDAESSTSSSSASTALKDWNGVRDLAGSKGLKSPGFLRGLLCLFGNFVEKKFRWEKGGVCGFLDGFADFKMVFMDFEMDFTDFEMVLSWIACSVGEKELPKQAH